MIGRGGDAVFQEWTYFRVERRGDVTVVTPTVSDLFGLAINSELRKELLRFVQGEKPEKVVVDFHNVQRFLTDWISTLLSLKKRLVVSVGQVKLCSMQPMHREIFRLCNLDGTVFQILEDVNEAVQSFS